MPLAQSRRLIGIQAEMNAEGSLVQGRGDRQIRRRVVTDVRIKNDKRFDPSGVEVVSQGRKCGWFMDR